MGQTRCFACNRVLKEDADRHWADTRDGQMVYVGPECLRKIKMSEDYGYQPPLGGPRLFLPEDIERLDQNVPAKNVKDKSE